MSALVFPKTLSSRNPSESSLASTIAFQLSSHLLQINSPYLSVCCSTSFLLPLLPQPHDTQQMILLIYSTSISLIVIRLYDDCFVYFSAISGISARNLRLSNLFDVTVIFRTS